MNRIIEYIEGTKLDSHHGDIGTEFDLHSILCILLIHPSLSAGTIYTRVYITKTLCFVKYSNLAFTDSGPIISEAL